MHLDDILHFLEQGFGLLPDAASRPLSLEWPDDAGQARRLASEIYARLDSGDRNTFATCLTASALARGGSEREISISAALAGRGETVPGLNLDLISSMSWTGIPLAVAEQGQGRIVYALLGTGENLDTNFARDAHDLLDKAAIQAVTNAARLSGLSRPSDFFFWLPACQNLKITGSSIGLPVYLGFCLLRKKIKWPDIICTGALSPEGKLLPVQGMADKAAAAGEAGFSALLYPASETVSLSDAADLETLPASSLDMALCLTQTYTPGRGGIHLSLLHSLDSLQASPDLLCRADFNLLRYLEEKDCLLSRKIRELAADNPDFSARLARRLKEMLKDRNPELNKLYFLLNRAFPGRTVENIGEFSADTGLELCFSHIQVRNHTGHILDLEFWQKLAQKYLQDLEARGETSTRELLANIYLTVGRLQNTYSFTPDKARAVTTPFKDLVNAAEKKFQARKSSNHNAVDECLGRYYGTMAQHFGFCGPDFLETTLNYCRLAQQAFGDGNWMDLRSDWLRSFSYMFFAWLDAQDLEQAEAALEKYLDTSLEKADIQSLDKFQHFHLCRFLAESGAKRPEYTDWAAEMFFKNNFWTREHPWQLWLLNMGRLARDPELKRQFWWESLDVCLSSYPTIKIMGLMPLSRLYELSLVADYVLKQAYEKTIADCKDSGLNREHFEPLWRLNWNEGLSKVYRETGMYFPFSYR